MTSSANTRDRAPNSCAKIMALVGYNSDDVPGYASGCCCCWDS